MRVGTDVGCRREQEVLMTGTMANRTSSSRRGLRPAGDPSPEKEITGIGNTKCLNFSKENNVINVNLCNVDAVNNQRVYIYIYIYIYLYIT